MKRWSVVLSLLIVAPCGAQQGTTAELNGRVTTGGQALAGVTVTIDSSSLQGPHSTITGENGGYRFTLLPPADYRLRVEVQGFTTAEKRVRLSLAEAMRANIDLTPAPLSEEIVVESKNEHVGADASIAMNFPSAPFLERLPGPRDIRAATLLSPSASALGVRNAIVIAGAPSWDSLFLVDGVAANEYLSGQPHDVVLEDAIEEIAVLTGAISAEYGRFTGGVVSTLTKSGGNEFSGSLRDTETNAAWTARTPWRDQLAAPNHANHAVEATLGGFLLMDRLWFFAASRNAKCTLREFTSLTNIAYPNTSRDQRLEGKLTSQIRRGHALIVSYLGADLAETNVMNRRSGLPVDLASLIPERSQPARLLSATYNGTLTTNSVAEIQFSKKRYALLGNGGQSIDRIAGTAIVTPGRNSNAPLGCGICGEDRRDSDAWSAKTSNYLNTRLGNHTAVIGGERFEERRTSAGTRSASDFNIQTGSTRVIGANAYPFFGPGTMIIWTPHFAGDTGTNMITSSAYVNDRWDVSSRCSFNVGLRYDRNHDRDAFGRLISRDHAFSPRLSATFDVRNDGRQQFFASYGVYGAKILEGGGVPQQVGTFNSYGWQYGGPPINGPAIPSDQLLSAPDALRRLFAWFSSIGGIQDRQHLSLINEPVLTSIFHRSLKSPSVTEQSLGYAIQIRKGHIRADYVARDWNHFYASRVDKATGQTIDSAGNKVDVAWIINDDSETVRNYRAIQLQTSWPYGRGIVGGAYAWSKLRGNDEEEETTGIGPPRNFPLQLWYPELLGYPQRRPFGYLQQDQRHRARLWITFETGRLSTSILQSFASGQAYSAVATIDPQSVLPNPGYALNQASTGSYYFSARGAFRTDDVYSTDVSLRYEIPIRGARLFVKGDTLNVFNNAAVISPGRDVADRANSGALSGLLPFNPFTEVPIEGVHYRLSPLFGKATGPESYQTPRTFQVAIGAHF